LLIQHMTLSLFQGYSTFTLGQISLLSILITCTQLQHKHTQSDPPSPNPKKNNNNNKNRKKTRKNKKLKQYNSPQKSKQKCTPKKITCQKKNNKKKKKNPTTNRSVSQFQSTMIFSDTVVTDIHFFKLHVYTKKPMDFRYNITNSA